MFSDFMQAAWGTAQRWFPDRQIYHRSEGQVRYFEVTTALQITALFAASALAFWIVFTTVSVAFQGYAMSAKEAEIDRIRLTAEARVSEAMAMEAAASASMESQREEFLDTVYDFEARSRMLARLVDFAEGLDGDRIIPSPTSEDGAVLMAATPADPAPRTARDAGYFPAAAVMPDPSAPPEARVSALMQQQDAALAEAENAAETRLENLRALLRLTGLNVEEVVEEGREDVGESGGPLLAISDSLDLDPSQASGENYAGRITRIATRMAEADELEEVLAAAPIGTPISVPHRQTSDYGPRLDPFTRRPAMHGGMDFSAYRRAPIIAAGPGRVIYAGWRTGYGRTVEIDHGFGMVSRYAHLHDIAVRRGDIVERGDQIGGMGNTGRSTATHLHFEVWFDGSHTDPELFLRAGEYVQQG